MDILYEPICPFIAPCKYPADIIPFFSKSSCLPCYMKRANFPYFSSTDNKKMLVKDLFLSALFQVVFDKLFSGLIFVFAHWDRIHVKLKNWSQRLSSIQAQIKDDAGETQWLRSAIDLAGEVTNLLDEMASFPGSEDLKETTRKILAYECLPSIGSTYATQEEEDNIKLPRTYRGKSSKWKKKYRPRKLYQRKSIKWKKKHPPKHNKKVTINKSVGVSSSTATKENHDQLIYSLVNPLASRIAALMSQRETDYLREIYQEKTPPKTHEHIHEEQSSSLHKGEGMIKSVELNIEPTTSATLDSTLGKVTELQSCMERRFVELEKMLRRVLNCIEKRDASPICAQNRKRQRAPKLPPAKRRKTKGPEMAKHPYTPPGSNVPSTPVVDATSNTPTLFFCSFVL